MLTGHELATLFTCAGEVFRLHARRIDSDHPRRRDFARGETGYVMEDFVVCATCTRSAYLLIRRTPSDGGSFAPRPLGGCYVGAIVFSCGRASGEVPR